MRRPAGGRGSNQYTTKPADRPGSGTRSQHTAEDVAWTFLDPGAKNWMEVGVTAADVGLWQDAGFTADSGPEWVSTQFSPPVAWMWSEWGFDPESAVQWNLCMFTPENAAAWSDAGFDASVAFTWRQAGFEAGTSGAASARPFLEAGVPSEEAGRWHSHGMSYTDRRWWIDRGTTDPDTAAAQPQAAKNSLKK